MIKRHLLCFLFLIVAGPIFSQHDTALIRKCYSDFKNIVEKGQGQRALFLVDSATMRYYSALANNIKKADRAGIEKCDSYEKLIILTMRHHYPKEKLLKMQGKELFLHAVDSGGITWPRYEWKYGTIKISGNSAKVEITRNRYGIAYCDFHKEAGVWKLNLPSLFAIRGEQDRSTFELTGKTELEIILQSINHTSSKPAGPEIFEPLTKK